MTMTTAIVTGATGFVGTYLITELLESGVSVTALFREGSPNISRLPSEVKIECDFAKLEPADVFYHLAWEDASGVGRGNAVTQSRNAELTLAALETAHRIGCGKFVALGTVYEKFAPQIRAAGKFGGSDFYVLSKDYTHAMTEKLALKLAVPFVWAEICHPVGQLIKPEQMMAYVISNLLGGKSPAFGPAKTLYDIVAVEDVALGLRLLGEYGLKNREYYIGSGNPRVLAAYLEDVRQILETETSVGIGERPADGLCFEESWFDIAPIAEETGYEPKVSFEQAVRNVADWVKTK